MTWGTMRTRDGKRVAFLVAAVLAMAAFTLGWRTSVMLALLKFPPSFAGPDSVLLL